MRIEHLFPYLIGSLSAFAAVIYLVRENYPAGIYWLCAAIITFTVTYSFGK